MMENRSNALMLFALLVPCMLRGQAGLNCTSHDNYYVVVKDRADSVLNDVLVKYGTGPHKCAYQPASGDYEMKEVPANTIVKLADQYLFLGGQSGPDGGTFAVFDLNGRKKVYEHSYSGTGVRINAGIVTFTETVGPAKRAECPKFDEITKMSLAPAIEADVSFAVADLAHPEKLKLLSPVKPRCVAHQ